MMDFAKQQLKKYGWKEGQGLGKDESGIVRPIRVGIKRDHAGVGAVPREEFSSDWWSALFNKAASNISVADSEGEVVIRPSTDNCDSASSLKKRHYGQHRSSLLYGGFIDSTLSYDNGLESRKQRKGRRRKEEKESVIKSADVESLNLNGERLSDEDLIKACEGRTGHKAARHGLELGGKLKRIKDQEEEQRDTAVAQTKKRKTASINQDSYRTALL